VPVCALFVRVATCLRATHLLLHSVPGAVPGGEAAGQGSDVPEAVALEVGGRDVGAVARGAVEDVVLVLVQVETPRKDVA